MEITGFSPAFAEAAQMAKTICDHYWNTQNPRSAQVADAFRRLLVNESIEASHVDAMESLWKEQQDPQNTEGF